MQLLQETDKDEEKKLQESFPEMDTTTELGPEVLGDSTELSIGEIPLNAAPENEMEHKYPARRLLRPSAPSVPSPASFPSTPPPSGRKIQDESNLSTRELGKFRIRIPSQEDLEELSQKSITVPKTKLREFKTEAGQEEDTTKKHPPQNGRSQDIRLLKIHPSEPSHTHQLRTRNPLSLTLLRMEQDKDSSISSNPGLKRMLTAKTLQLEREMKNRKKPLLITPVDAQRKRQVAKPFTSSLLIEANPPQQKVHQLFSVK
jgi:hypothetical protein